MTGVWQFYNIHVVMVGLVHDITVLLFFVFTPKASFHTQQKTIY